MVWVVTLVMGVGSFLFGGGGSGATAATLAAGPPGAIAFTGTVSTSPGLGDVVLAPGTDGAWYLQGSGAGTTTLGPAFGTIRIAGALTDSYCGLTTGSDGAGQLAIGTWVYELTGVGWPTTSGYTYHFTGTSNGAATVAGEMTWARPGPAGGVGNCVTHTATVFPVVGWVAVTG